MKILLIGLAAAWPLVSFAQDSQQPSTDQPMPQPPSTGMPQPSTMQPGAVNISSQDREFVKKAASAGMFEVEAANLALQKSQDDSVKSTAQHILSDHQSANDQLRRIADTDRLTLPMQMSPEDQKKIDKLRAKSGKDFDKTFLSTQDQAHKDAISLFQKEMSKGQDPALKSFAEQTLPTLRMHQQMVERTQHKM
jgi:putative membrane protein